MESILPGHYLNDDGAHLDICPRRFIESTKTIDSVGKRYRHKPEVNELWFPYAQDDTAALSLDEKAFLDISA